MLRNYLTIAWRNILKDKFYSLINILGLTIGVTCGLLLLLYVTDELSFDRYHEKRDRIYRIVSNITEPDKINHWRDTQAPLAKTLRQDYPFVENYVRFFPYGRVMFRRGEKRFYETDVYAADSTVFDVFSYTFIEGDPKTALDRPGNVVLTQTTARKFFGNQPALGQSLQTNDTTFYKVAGVIEDVPKNSHFTFNALFALGPNERQADYWGNFYVVSYLLLPENFDTKILESKFPQLYEKHMASIFQRMGIKITYELQPLTKIHLHSKLDGEAGGDIGYVYTFAAVAFFMLLIASINYMNLSTARSAKRAKEVGLRKVMGSLRKALMAQFLTESVLMTVLALTASLIFVALLLPFFNTVSGKEIQFRELLQPQFLLIALAIVVFTGFISGSYPAFYLSSFEPATVLKGSFNAKGGSFFRKTLVVAQFSISLIMLICTWIVYQQLNYMRNKDLGYDREQVLTVDYQDGQPRDRYNALRTALLTNPNIRSVATASSPTSNIGGRVIFAVESNTGLKEMGFKPMGIDHDYLKTMGMKVVSGRDFSADIPADTTNGVLINQAAVKRMGWTEPLGKKVLLGGLPQAGQPSPPTAKVVGVVKDFHQQSLYSPIEPMIMVYRPNNGVVHIKIDAKNADKTVAFIGQKWRETYPDRLFEYRFLDQDFESAYRADELRGRVFTAFSTLTILIACLGLFGLATFTTEQRVKEIGVRKVLGASVSNVVFLLSKDFTKLVLFSFPIAIPVAWYSMDRWLQHFPYKTEIGVGVFVMACALTLFICWITVIYQSLKAAVANPVKSLRSE
ncbi:putative ABC transport system permease protein [Larkinella arboricola]|uniref:Putative ABC transport system permease protein n=1 Tax=Larkinella arboricola TaxID=643671 RepID=A0A327X766_LARAB|nr:ABC transporter permease [Larkinella arboricola]RAK02837.1 putative ABC transport system permease protein [Larkinella arboricola]